MKFIDTGIDGAYLIEIEPITDERGYFARSWCRREFAEHGLSTDIEQVNVGVSSRKGTLRGMHYQNAPDAEVKVVSCPRGAVFDAIVDLRSESATYRQWYAAELSADNGNMLYVPEGCAHGYLTLRDDTLLVYNTSRPYAPGSATGVRWDDPAFAIEWPAEPAVISAADRDWPYVDRD